MNSLLDVIDTPLKAAHEAREALFRSLTAPAEALHQEWKEAVKAMNAIPTDEAWRDCTAAASIRQMEALASFPSDVDSGQAVLLADRQNQIDTLVAACNSSIPDAFHRQPGWIEQIRGADMLGSSLSLFDRRTVLAGALPDLTDLGLTHLVADPMGWLERNKRQPYASPTVRRRERSSATGHAQEPARSTTPETPPVSEALPIATTTQMPAPPKLAVSQPADAVSLAVLDAMACLIGVATALSKATGNPLCTTDFPNGQIFRLSVHLSAQHPFYAGRIARLISSLMGIFDRMDAPRGTTQIGYEAFDQNDAREMRSLSDELNRLLARLDEIRP